MAAADAYLAFACGLADFTRASADFRTDCQSNIVNKLIKLRHAQDMEDQIKKIRSEI